MSTAEFASRGIGESPWSRNILGHMVGEFGATDALLSARRERPPHRAAERSYQFPPSDSDRHVALPCEGWLVKGTISRRQRAVCFRHCAGLAGTVGKVLVDAVIAALVFAQPTYRLTSCEVASCWTSASP